MMTGDGVGRRVGGRKRGDRQIEKRRLTYRDRQRQTWGDTRGGDRHRDIETDRQTWGQGGETGRQRNGDRHTQT